jgi:hypothetical protein
MENAKDRLAIVVEVYDPMEADMIKGLLESSGIKTIIHLKTHGSITGIGESYGKIPIYVPESDLEKAKAFLLESEEEDEKADRDWAVYVEKKHAALDKYLSWFWLAISSVFVMLALSMPDVTDEQKTFKAIFYGVAVVAFVIMLRGLSELPRKRGE